MFKKITALILSIALVLSMTVFAKFNDVDENSEYSNAIERLVQYGILSGKGDGQFDPDAGLTRAEMAKISTVVAGLDSLASSSKGTSSYSDMDGSFWASGYVNVAAKNKLILGYPDGTYAPEQSLTFAEAVTVVLRLLGYTSEDLGDNWPAAYTAKAAELSLTEGIYCGDYDLISRANISLIIDRALLADTDKNDSTPYKTLIQRMDYSITDECIVLATSAESKNLLSDEVGTTIGTYKKINDSVNGFVTRKVKLVLNKDNKVVNVMPISQTGKDIIIQGVVGTEIAYTEGGISSSLKLDNTSVVYYQGAKKMFSDVKSLMETGMTMAVYYSTSGVYDYAVIKDFEILGPIVMIKSLTGNETSIGEFALNQSGLRVIRDGYESKLSEIKTFDVVYYNMASNILYVYCDKVSGVYEKALPNKASITKLTLSGVEYELETQDAVKLVGEYPGAYKINDYMTLLLGKDGKVVSAVNMNDTDLTVYGIILSCSERLSVEENTKGTKENFISVYTVTGIEQEFKTDKDYTQYRGRIIKYQFSDGLLIPQFITNRKISGKVDVASRTIGDYWLSNDAKIIDLSYAPAINESGNAQASLIEMSDITNTSFTEVDVIHANLDSKFNDIQFIVLNNVTMSKYQYGIVTSKNSTSGFKVSSTFKIDINGTEKSYSQSKIFQPNEGQPIMASIQNGSLLELKSLSEVQTKGSYVASDMQRIKVGTTSYKMASDVVAYLYKDYKYLSVSVNDIPSHNIKSTRLFIDKPILNGGLVRVIIFTE